MQVGTRAARARAMADRDFRAAARRLREAGVRGDRSACEPEAWARKEGSQPGAEEDEAVHPRSDRPGRRARRKRSQVQIAPGDRAPFFASESGGARSEEHTSELQSQSNLVCRLLLEKKKIYRYLLRIFPARQTHYFTITRMDCLLRSRTASAWARSACR